jgi:hypothetical protein
MSSTDEPHPEHPIEMPGEEPHPEHPIEMPGEEPHPEHPIVLPPDVPETEPPDQPEVPPDTEPPVSEEEELDFFQRVTLGFNWNQNTVGTEGEEVGVDAWVPDDEANFDGEGTWRNVRSVPNTGSSSVTYPADFTGPVRIRVRGSAATVPGDFTVT